MKLIIYTDIDNEMAVGIVTIIIISFLGRPIKTFAGDLPLNIKNQSVRPIAHWAAIQNMAASVGAKCQPRQTETYACYRRLHSHTSNTECVLSSLACAVP